MKSMTFSEYIISKQDLPFNWGRHDCVHFAAGWVEILRYGKAGRRLAAGFYLAGRPWANRAQAYAAIHAAGQAAAGKPLTDLRYAMKFAVDAVLQPVQNEFAVDGDVCLMADGLTLGLISGANAIVATRENGLVRVPRGSIMCAWSTK